MLDYEPLKILFHMETPICLTYPFIHFDGILSHLVQRKYNEGYRWMPSKQPIKLGQERGEQRLIPLKRLAGIYHGSVSIFDTSESYTTMIYKKFCEKYLDLQRVHRRIDTRRGHFKNYMINLVYVPAKTVTFYACGVRERIEELLDNLPGLGKKISDGFGFIKSFEINTINQDLSIVNNGIAMRTIPMSMCAWSEEVVQLAYEPPYWAKENVRLCCPPFAHVKLTRNLERRIIGRKMA